MSRSLDSSELVYVEEPWRAVSNRPTLRMSLHLAELNALLVNGRWESFEDWCHRMNDDIAFCGEAVERGDNPLLQAQHAYLRRLLEVGQRRMSESLCR